MSKLILIMQNQTESEKNALVASWADAVADGCVEVASNEESDLTWTTTINTIIAETNKVTIESEFDDPDWNKKVTIHSDTPFSKEVTNPDGYTVVRFVF